MLPTRGVTVPAVVIPPQFNTGIKPTVPIPPVIVPKPAITTTVPTPTLPVSTPTVPVLTTRTQIAPQTFPAQPIVPRPIVPKPTAAIQPTQGGLLKQFGGGTGVVTVGTVPQVTAAPTIRIVEETGYTLLMKLLDTWDGTQEQAQELSLKVYQDGTPIIDVKRRDVINEIICMLRNQEYDEVIDFLTDAPNPEYVLWDQSSLDEGRIKVARETVIQQAEEVGVKGVGKCRYCNSTELVFSQRQLRSGDEPATIFVRCVLCTKQWRQ